jgi:hypothetical protein
MAILHNLINATARWHDILIVSNNVHRFSEILLIHNKLPEKNEKCAV